LSSGLSRTASCFPFVGGAFFRVTKAPCAVKGPSHGSRLERHSTRGLARERLSQTNELLRGGCNCGRSSFGRFWSVQGGTQNPWRVRWITILKPGLPWQYQAWLSSSVMTGTQQYCDSGAFLPRPAKCVAQFRDPNQEVDKKIRRTRPGNALVLPFTEPVSMSRESFAFPMRLSFLVPRSIKTPDWPWRNLFRPLSLATGRIILACRCWVVIKLIAWRKTGSVHRLEANDSKVAATNFSPTPRGRVRSSSSCLKHSGNACSCHLCSCYPVTAQQ
jgi:hypothetical protein